MKTKLIIVLFLLSLILMATDSIIQGVIALGGFGLSVHLLNGNKKEVKETIIRFENGVMNLLKKLLA